MPPLELPYGQTMFLAQAACASGFAFSDRIEMVRLLIADTTAQGIPSDPDSQREFAELKKLLPLNPTGGLVGADFKRVFDLVASLWTRMDHPGNVA